MRIDVGDLGDGSDTGGHISVGDERRVKHLVDRAPPPMIDHLEDTERLMPVADRPHLGRTQVVAETFGQAHPLSLTHRSMVD